MSKPIISIIMGSRSDLETLKETINLLREFKVNFLPKIKIEIVAKDSEADKIVNAISTIAKTGAIGDGKIFVYPVENALRIRTGEKGEAAL